MCNLYIFNRGMNVDQAQNAVYSDEYNIQINKCRGQEYDGASSGVNWVVQMQHLHHHI